MALLRRALHRVREGFVGLRDDEAPVLMLNGRFDYFFPTDSSQEPLFDLLGTPGEHKRRVVYEASHNIPRHEMIKEVVNWIEKYWGPPTPRY